MPHLPRTVHLVAHAPILHAVRLLVTVRPAQLAPLRAFLKIAILNVGHRHFRRAGAEIKTQQRLGVDQFAPLEKFVRAELIGFDGIPGAFQDGRSLVLWPDAIEPVVTGDEIAARITNDRDAEFFDLCEDVLTKSIFVGEL